ncbi:hypothetical protein DFR68_10836 [Nocardia mexicana]|uniref:Peptidase inhibitor family I36 n=2 Tax=Nocardia mexicana TaxID=279262 RepID=A0A370GX14_9NOCA|nr:hypothetical protein DFR68_10836 [Nocardia mexicana]
MAVASAPVIAAAPAQAALECPYPNVCFYDDSGRRTGEFNDVTSEWQNIPPGAASHGARLAYNTRNDDVAYLRFEGGKQLCLPPGQVFDLSNGTLNGIRIAKSAKCE